MRIIVCLKRVGYLYDPTAVDLSTGDIDPEKMAFMLNPYDEVAVEEAIRIKECAGGGEIILLSAGPVEVEETLRYAWAMGGRQIDRVIRIDDDSFDRWKTARLLAQTIERLKFDLILCGKKAIDTNAGQVGTFIAELLDLPQVSGIVNLDFPAQGKAIAERYMGKGDREEVECQLPALFTAELGLNEARYPAVTNRLQAEKLEIEVLDPASSNFLGSDGEAASHFVKYSPPRPKTRKIFTPDSNLSVMERMSQMVSGGAAKKEGGTVWEGSAEEAAGHILHFLRQNKILEDAE